MRQNFQNVTICKYHNEYEETKDQEIMITEQDIFNYVFFPDSVSPEKKIIIQNDKNLVEAIDFIGEILKATKRKPEISLRKKLADKIPAYSYSNLIRLNAINGMLPERNKHLAADSEARTLISKMMSHTFTDEDQEFMIKVISTEKTSKVFVFSNKNEEIKNFDIIIQPDNLRFHFNDNSQPLTIDHKIEIKDVQIQFL